MAIELPPELTAKIAQWRSKALEGTISPAEMREAIIALRQARISAAREAVTKRTTSAKQSTTRSADDLLSEL